MKIWFTVFNPMKINIVANVFELYGVLKFFYIFL